MNAMRDTIPIEKLLKSYMDPTIEEDVEINETTSVINRETLVDSANTSGVDVDVGMYGVFVYGVFVYGVFSLSIVFNTHTYFKINFQFLCI